ncbi:site-specific integrase [Nitrosopumilus cobalaminigenes]|uniref:site-specific integrase n=1 Tax=Nitrosopumilus cobalaminigenes TaxID=1470066 RepID=UPI0015CE402D|nr:site-specific integrase [Nitrosopumilus cobalaminigenes]
MQRSLLLFENAIHSDATMKLYTKGLQNFMQFVGYENKHDEYASLHSKVIDKHLEDYVLYQSHRKIKGITVRNYLKPIYLFLDVNRIQYFPKAINRLIPRDKTKKGSSKPFTDKDIQDMLDYTNSSRNKALVLFFSSIGGRPAVLTDPILCFKHLHVMPHGCKAVLMYENSDEEYWGFLTPEASNALEVYRDERIRNGEIISQESPLFAIQKKNRFKEELYLSIPALNSIFENLERKANIEKIKTGYRYDKALMYGFRKRFNTILKIESTVNSNIAEKLLAHKNGLDGVYLKPTREECFEEFLKAVPELTVSKAEKLSLKLEKSESEKDKKILKLELEMKEVYKLLEQIRN